VSVYYGVNEWQRVMWRESNATGVRTAAGANHAAKTHTDPGVKSDRSVKTLEIDVREGTSRRPAPLHVRTANRRRGVVREIDETDQR